MTDLSVKVNWPRLLPRDVPRLKLRREKLAVDVAFEPLLSNANQELGRLLRDVRKGPQTALYWNTYSRRMSDLLVRAVRCAAKQYMLQAELGNLALRDELTGLYNRRGFQALAERQLKLGRRFGREMLLFFIDVDGLKQINDSCGHGAGDAALKCAADALKKTFRDSDIVARLAGDEFAVLAIEASGRGESTIVARLNKYVHAVNSGRSLWTISLSVGVARFDHNKPASIKELMAQADQDMYAHKRRRSSFRITVPARSET